MKNLKIYNLAVGCFCTFAAVYNFDGNIFQALSAVFAVLNISIFLKEEIL